MPELDLRSISYFHDVRCRQQQDLEFFFLIYLHTMIHHIVLTIVAYRRSFRSDNLFVSGFDFRLWKNKASKMQKCKIRAIWWLIRQHKYQSFHLLTSDTIHKPLSKTPLDHSQQHLRTFWCPLETFLLPTKFNDDLVLQDVHWC